MQASTTVDELTDIQHQLIAGWAAGDPSAHERILADDWSVIDPTGNIMTKADVLATAFSGEREIELADIDQLRIRDLDGFAVVSGRTRVIGKIAGQDIKMTLRFTDVFDRRSGQWKCIASQGTFVNEPEEE